MNVNSDEEIQKILVQLESGHLIDYAFVEQLADSADQMEKVAELWGDNVYSSLLKALTYKVFPPVQAKQYWQEIVRHRSTLEKQLNRDPGVAIAALDYLSNLNDKLSNPAIIEANQLHQIANFATKDELTGLYVRKIFEHVLDQHVSEAQRYKFELCLMMIDIDDFKQFNDTYGHQAGDEVLRSLGDVINHTIRDSDIAARYGGEELAIITPKTSLKEARKLAERLRLAISRSVKSPATITVSIGIAQLEEQQSSEKLVENADSCLYIAKEQGKNQTVAVSQ